MRNLGEGKKRVQCTVQHRDLVTLRWTSNRKVFLKGLEENRRKAHQSGRKK